MNTSKYKKLFEKGRIGNLELKNRSVMTSMGTNFVTAMGEAGEEYIKYMEARAKGGVGLIVTEVTCIDDNYGVAQACQFSMTKPYHMQGLVRLCEAVHAHDTKIFCQLWHPGYCTPPAMIGGKQPFTASDATCPIMGIEGRAMTTEEVETFVAQHAKAALMAKTAGFDGVELHAAHGYLLSQFISPNVNVRTDRFGGSRDGRIQVIKEVIEAIQAACGKNFPISVRMNGSDYVEGGLTEEDAIYNAQKFEEFGATVLNVSAGTYASGFASMDPQGFAYEGWKKHLATNIKKVVKLPIIAVNTVKHPAFAEELLESGVSDFVGIARGHLADPDFMTKAYNGEDDKIHHCLGCLECFRMGMMGRPLECVVNPYLGREYLYNDDTLKKNGNGKPVAVIGGGPGGMEAAVVLAKRGFKVTLFEAQDHLGGTINLADKPPHKEALTELIKTLELEMKELGVTVKLGVKAGVKECKEIGAVGVFVANGGTPILPPLPGADKCIIPEDILLGKVQLKGKKVVIVGGGVTGLETAETICADNDVTIVEMLDAVGTTLYALVGRLLIKRLTDNGTEIMTGHAISEVKDGKAIVKEVATDKTVELDADVVVMALGVKPDRSVGEELEKEFEKVIYIGDAEKAGTIKNAMHAAVDKCWVFEA